MSHDNLLFHRAARFKLGLAFLSFARRTVVQAMSDKAVIGEPLCLRLSTSSAVYARFSCEKSNAPRSSTAPQLVQISSPRWASSTSPALLHSGQTSAMLDLGSPTRLDFSSDGTIRAFIGLSNLVGSNGNFCINTLREMFVTLQHNYVPPCYLDPGLKSSDFPRSVDRI